MAIASAGPEFDWVAYKADVDHPPYNRQSFGPVSRGFVDDARAYIVSAAEANPMMNPMPRHFEQRGIRFAPRTSAYEHGRLRFPISVGEYGSGGPLGLQNR